MKTSLTSLDEARAANPELSMTVYAYRGELVTLEIITPDEQTYQFKGPTEAAVLAAAFPGDVRDEDQQEPASIFD
jgi:hypothetical protein